jgi:hypothetical protein
MLESRIDLDEVFLTVEPAPIGVNRQETVEIVKPLGLAVARLGRLSGDWLPLGAMKRTSTTR